MMCFKYLVNIDRDIYLLFFHLSVLSLNTWIVSRRKKIVYYFSYIPKIWYAYRIAREKNILFLENFTVSNIKRII